MSFDGPDVDAVSAGEDVDGCVAVLGPRVDGEVGLGDDDDPTDALGSELVEGFVDDGSAAFDGGVVHRDFDGVRVVEQRLITVVAFHQDLDSKRFHGGEGG